MITIYISAKAELRLFAGATLVVRPGTQFMSVVRTREIEQNANTPLLFSQGVALLALAGSLGRLGDASRGYPVVLKSNLPQILDVLSGKLVKPELYTETLQAYQHLMKIPKWEAQESTRTDLPFYQKMEELCQRAIGEIHQRSLTEALRESETPPSKPLGQEDLFDLITEDLFPRRERAARSNTISIPQTPESRGRLMKDIERLKALGSAAKFSDFASLRVGGTDEFSALKMRQLIQLLPPGAETEALDKWLQQAILDNDPESTMSFKDRASTYRWILRGLTPEMAVRKVRTDRVISANASKREV